MLGEARINRKRESKYNTSQDEKRQNKKLSLPQPSVRSIRDAQAEKAITNPQRLRFVISADGIPSGLKDQARLVLSIMNYRLNQDAKKEQSERAGQQQSDRNENKIIVNRLPRPRVIPNREIKSDVQLQIEHLLVSLLRMFEHEKVSHIINRRSDNLMLFKAGLFARMTINGELKPIVPSYRTLKRRLSPLNYAVAANFLHRCSLENEEVRTVTHTIIYSAGEGFFGLASADTSEPLFDVIHNVVRSEDSDDTVDDNGTFIRCFADVLVKESVIPEGYLTYSSYKADETLKIHGKFDYLLCAKKFVENKIKDIYSDKKYSKSIGRVCIRLNFGPSDLRLSYSNEWARCMDAIATLLSSSSDITRGKAIFSMTMVSKRSQGKDLLIQLLSNIRSRIMNTFFSNDENPACLLVNGVPFFCYGLRDTDKNHVHLATSLPDIGFLEPYKDSMFIIRYERGSNGNEDGFVYYEYTTNQASDATVGYGSMRRSYGNDFGNRYHDRLIPSIIPRPPGEPSILHIDRKNPRRMEPGFKFIGTSAHCILNANALVRIGPGYNECLSFSNGYFITGLVQPLVQSDGARVLIVNPGIGALTIAARQVFGDVRVCYSRDEESHPYKRFHTRLVRGEIRFYANEVPFSKQDFDYDDDVQGIRGFAWVHYNCNWNKKTIPATVHDYIMDHRLPTVDEQRRSPLGDTWISTVVSFTMPRRKLKAPNNKPGAGKDISAQPEFIFTGQYDNDHNDVLVDLTSTFAKYVAEEKLEILVVVHGLMYIVILAFVAVDVPLSDNVSTKEKRVRWLANNSNSAIVSHEYLYLKVAGNEGRFVSMGMPRP